MKYKRLTVIHPNGYISISETKQLPNTREANLVLNRLAELENKIENGTLMEIDKPFVKPTKYGKYLLCKATVVWIASYNTKAEAEEKLKELKKNEK